MPHRTPVIGPVGMVVIGVVTVKSKTSVSVWRANIGPGSWSYYGISFIDVDVLTVIHIYIYITTATVYIDVIAVDISATTAGIITPGGSIFSIVLGRSLRVPCGWSIGFSRRTAGLVSRGRLMGATINSSGPGGGLTVSLRARLRSGHSSPAVRHPLGLYFFGNTYG